MSDSFQKLVDRDATADEAEGLARRVLAFLVARGVVRSEPSDSILRGDGYAPGPNADDVVTPPAHDFRSLADNGMKIITGRTVFWGDDGAELICPRCGARFGDTFYIEHGTSVAEWPEAWSAAVDEWFAGEGPGTLVCPRYRRATSVTEWGYDPPWAFGYLGFEFWNRPPLREAFVAEVAALLGHRVVVVRGKL